MEDLKNTTIGGKSITLKRVPASKARGIQTLLIAIVAEPLADALGQQASTKKTTKSKAKGSEQGEMILAGLKGIAGILPSLNDGDLDSLIEKCKPYIMVDGKPFDEDTQFDSDTLFDMYEVLWYFLKETFGGFISAVLSRFPQAKAMTALKK